VVLAGGSAVALYLALARYLRISELADLLSLVTARLRR
jgi:hypothetical protein